LFDEAGNDFYNGSVFSQGVAYWYALGILIDLQGNDFYNASWYPQGSGIHLAAGFLYDESGDDVYFSKRGPGQGGAHDWAVGFLVDRAGNDFYSADGNCGFAITNSVAVFVDAGGNDRYERKRSDSYGHGGIAREMGSIGIFLDTGGNDVYANEHQGNDMSWVSGIYGIGRDMNIVREPVEEPVVVGDEPAIDEFILDENMPINELFALAAQWDIVTVPRERVSEARRVLLEREAEAVPYIFENMMHTGSISIQRTILDFARNSDLFKESLPDGLKSSRARTVSNTIMFIGILGLIEYVDTFEEMISEGKNIDNILSALGRLRTEKSIDILAEYIHSADRYRRVTAVRALKEMNMPRSLEIVLSLDGHECFLIKSMVDIVKGSR
jgi:hypothetical protein